MPPTQQEAHRRHAEYYRSILQSAKSLYGQGHNNVGIALSLFDSDWENIRAGQTWAAAVRGNDLAFSRMCISYSLEGISILELR